jgi:plastocyanin
MSNQDSSPKMDRRGLLKCAPWAGAGVVWTLQAGVLSSVELLDTAQASAAVAQAAAAPQARTIAIGNFTFSPANIEVPVGTQVTWSNEDDVPHKIVGTDGGPVTQSPPLDTDQKYTTVFARPGTYRYFCSLHPHMTGTVVVR